MAAERPNFQKPALDSRDSSSTDAASTKITEPSKFRRIKNAYSMVANLREGDGIDPRMERRKRQRARSEGKPDYAAERLAAQISRCVNANLGDGILADFVVLQVTPGKGNSFIITLRATNASQTYDAKEIQSLAVARLPVLRMDLSREIHRKKVPNLLIRVIPQSQSLAEESLD